MDFLKKKVIAWSKLATGGARPLAESVGMDRDFFARVLNNRRPLPDENAIALEAALALDSSGFKANKIQSNLARHLEDVEGVLALGFQMHCVAEIRTTREARGGVVPQKYAAVIFSYGETTRLSVLRMARDKWPNFCTRFKAEQLPVLVVDTDVLPLLNGLDMGIRVDLWDWLNESFFAADHKQMVEAVQNILKTQLEVPEEIRGRVRAAQRLTRATVLEKLTQRSSTVALWPSGALDFARTHVLSPVTEEFMPANAIAIRQDGKRVFVWIMTIGEDERLTIPHEVIAAVDHALVFLKMPWAREDSHHVLFDGPAQLLAGKSSDGDPASTRYQRTAKWIRDRRFDVPPEQTILVRDDGADLEN